MWPKGQYKPIQTFKRKLYVQTVGLDDSVYFLKIWFFAWVHFKINVRCMWSVPEQNDLKLPSKQSATLSTTLFYMNYYLLHELKHCCLSCNVKVYLIILWKESVFLVYGAELGEMAGTSVQRNSQLWSHVDREVSLRLYQTMDLSD